MYDDGSQFNCSISGLIASGYLTSPTPITRQITFIGPPNAYGVAVVSQVLSPQPIPVLGVNLYLGQPYLALYSGQLDANGSLTVPVPLLVSNYQVQAGFFDPSTGSLSTTPVITVR